MKKSLGGGILLLLVFFFLLSPTQQKEQKQEQEQKEQQQKEEKEKGKEKEKEQKEEEERKKTNIIVILVDDLGYGDTPNNKTLPTPNINLLSQSSLLLSNLYVPSPICTPSRAALLTGRLPLRSGMVSDIGIFRAINSPGTPSGLPRSEITIATALKQSPLQYHTKMIGKWHLGVNLNDCLCLDSNEDPLATGDINDSPCQQFFGFKCFFNWFFSSSLFTNDMCPNCTYQNGYFLPTHHGFDSYYGMPVTNVETCDPNFTIYPDSTLFSYLFRSQSRVFVALFVIMAIFSGFKPSFSTLLKSSLLTIIFLAVLYMYVLSTTLLSQHSCVLYRDDVLVEQPVQLENLTVRFTDEATSFIHSQSPNDPPFFLFMSYVKVHTALFTSPAFKGKSKHHGEYGDNVMEMDWSVGQIINALQTKDLLHDTLIFFTSDNGPFLERGKRGGFAGYDLDSSLPPSQSLLKGGKGQTWEGGIRVPGIVHWPARIKPGRISYPMSTMDFFTTILSAAGVEIPRDREIDGVDLLPLFTKQTEEEPHKQDGLPFYCSTSLSAFRLGDYKAHFSTAKWEEGTESCPNNPYILCGCGGFVHDPPLLYHLRNDPGERNPIDSETEEYKTTIKKILKAKEKHDGSIKDVYSFPRPAEGIARPWLVPCCNPPSCQCLEEQ